MPWYSSLANRVQHNVLLLAESGRAASKRFRINEVLDLGTYGSWNGNDWIKIYLHTISTAAMDLASYILHEDKGSHDDNAFNFKVIWTSTYWIQASNSSSATMEWTQAHQPSLELTDLTRQPSSIQAAPLSPPQDPCRSWESTMYLTTWTRQPIPSSTHQLLLL